MHCSGESRMEKSRLNPAGTPFTQTDTPGIYSATVGGKIHQFAVNLPWTKAALRHCRRMIWLASVSRCRAPRYSAAKPPGARRHLLQAEAENRQKLWRWAIAGLLGVALVEILLGGWLARRVSIAEVTP